MIKLPMISDLEQALELAFNTPMRIEGNPEISVKGDAIKLVIHARLGEGTKSEKAYAANEENCESEPDPLRMRPSKRRDIIIAILHEALPEPIHINVLARLNGERGGDTNNFRAVLRKMREQSIITVTSEGWISLA